MLAIAALCCATSTCTATAKLAANNHGIEACAPGAADLLLSVDALQCWFHARHGRWRTIKHESHLDVLVVEVEAWDLRDAEDVARQFADQQGTQFSEILVYVNSGRPGQEGRVRRVQWTRESGIASFDFSAPVHPSR